MAINWNLGQPTQWTGRGHGFLLEVMEQMAQAKARREETEKRLASEELRAQATNALTAAHHKAQESHWGAQDDRAERAEQRMGADTASQMQHRKAIEENNRAARITGVLKDLPLDSSDPAALARHQAALNAAGVEIRPGLDTREMGADEANARFEKKMAGEAMPDVERIEKESKAADALRSMKGLPGVGALLPTVAGPSDEQKTWAAEQRGKFAADMYEDPDPNSQKLVGPGGKPLATFNPALNALNRATAAQKQAEALKKVPGVGGRAAAMTQALAGTNMPMDKVAEKAIEAGQKREALDVSQQNAAMVATQRAHSSGSEEENREDIERHRFIKQWSGSYGMPKLIDAEKAASETLMQLKQNSGLSDTVTLAKLGRSLYGAAQSNQEGGRLFNAGGLLTRVENAIQRLENGQFSPEFRKDMEALASRMQSYTQQRKLQVFSKAKSLAEKSPTLAVRNHAEYVASMIVGMDLVHDAAPVPAAAPAGKRTSTSGSTVRKGLPALQPSAPAPAEDDDPLDAELKGLGY